MHREGQETHIDTDEARAGETTGAMRWVLLISTLLAIVALTVIWVTGALTQDPVESEGTATGRIEQQLEQGETVSQSSVDSVAAERGDQPSEPATVEP